MGRAETVVPGGEGQRTKGGRWAEELRTANEPDACRRDVCDPRSANTGQPVRINGGLWGPEGPHQPFSGQTDGRAAGQQSPLLCKVELPVQLALSQDGAVLAQSSGTWATGDPPDITEGALNARHARHLLISGLFSVQVQSRVTPEQTPYKLFLLKVQG